MGPYFPPKNQFFSKLQKCIPNTWKQKQKPTKPFHKPLISSNSPQSFPMVGVLIASLKDFVTHNHLPNAFKTFIQIQHHQHHAANSTSNGYFELIFEPIKDLLSSCTNLKYLHQGKQLHAQIISLGIDKNSILISKLVNYYGNVGLLSDAESVTESSNSLNPLHWNIVISLYLRNCLFNEAIAVYRKMLSKGVKLDAYTYPSIIKACGELVDYDTGVEVHKCIRDGSINRSLFVDNALIFMYGRFEKLDVARKLFDSMPVRDCVSWNTIINCYAHRGLREEAEGLFRRMQKAGVEMNVITWNTIAGVFMHTKDFKGALNLLSQMRRSIQLDSVAMVVGLNACSHIRIVKLGKEIHGHAIRTCFDVFNNVKNALITMYSRCGEIDHAYMLFRKMDEKGLITWNAMLSGFAHTDQAEKVFCLFREMLHEGVEPNFVTIASVLPLCARMRNLQHGVLPLHARMKNLQHGKEFHCYMVKRGHQFNDHLLLWNSLVEMYSRSSEVLEARKVFDSLNRRDKVAYTSMIMGYGMNKDGNTALKLFEEMCMLDIKPDHVTMVAVLMACGRSRFVEKGQFLFQKMIEVYRINPTVEHYSCMVHLFGMQGLLKKAKKIIMEMPCSPTSEMWATLMLTSYIHKDPVMEEWAKRKLYQMYSSSKN